MHSDSRGAVALRRYLKRRGLTAAQFSRESGIHESTVSRALAGKKISLSKAGAFQDATGGAVRVPWWLEPARGAA